MEDTRQLLATFCHEDAAGKFTAALQLCVCSFPVSYNPAASVLYFMALLGGVDLSVNGCSTKIWPGFRREGGGMLVNSCCRCVLAISC